MKKLEKYPFMFHISVKSALKTQSNAFNHFCHREDVQFRQINFFPPMCRFRCFDQRAPTVQIWSRLDHPVDIYGVDMIQTPLVLWINELYKSFNWFDWCFWGLQWTILLSRSLIFLSHWASIWLFIIENIYLIIENIYFLFNFYSINAPIQL